MVNDLINKNKKRGRGRPVGSSARTLNVVAQIGTAINEAIHILPEKYGVTLPEVLAESFKTNPTATLQAISRYLPQNINLNVGPDNPSTTALKEINEKIIDHDNNK